MTTLHIPPPGSEVVLASGNAGKLAEFRELLAPLGWRLRGLEGFDLPEETGETFEANALLKARAAAAHTGLAALADDSGLSVWALGGAPGVRSARYGGKATDAERSAHLLEQLGENPDRAARFVCVLALVAGGAERTFRGELPGHIVSKGRGAGGFGYDPLFVPEGEGRTLAEMSRAEKGAIGHRGQAVRALLAGAGLGS